jgi:hypothetical protein
MRFLTIANKHIRFSFTAKELIYDREVIRESAYNEIFMEMYYSPINGLNSRYVRIADGKIKMYKGSIYAEEIALRKDIEMQIALLSIDLNNMLLMGNHEMRGESIYSVEPSLLPILEEYIKFVQSSCRSTTSLSAAISKLSL